MKKALSVLMLEDDPLDAELIREAVACDDLQFEFTRVDTRLEFVQALESRPWDLILADQQLPSFDGLSALKLAQRIRPETPFLVVSGVLGEELAVHVLKSGATDYVLKDHLDRLLPSVRRAFREAEAREERRRAEQALRFVAEASAELAASIDYFTTLHTAARLPVPFLADWSLLCVVEEDEVLYPAASWHKNPALRDVVETFVGRGLGEIGPLPFAREMAAVGIPLLLPEIGPEELRRAGPEPQIAARLEAAGFSSLMVVPVRTRRRMLGALTLVSGKNGRRFRADDLSLAEDLARRIALALDAARLHHDLQMADRRKDEFLAMLAHELRNPLAPILTAMELARHAGTTDPQLRRAHAVVERQARHMVRLVEDLLDVSRITRGKVELRRERVDLRQILENAVQTSRPVIEHRQHTLEILLPEEPIPVDADPARLEQVVTNLLNNAARYTEPGGNITLRGWVDGGEACISVKDTGVGIPHDMLRRVFDLFVQVNPGLDRSKGGLGLGLTLVRRLVEMHGGSVIAQSDGPGAGSVFVVRLPLAQPPGPAAEAPGTHAEGHPPAWPSDVRRVLICEDNADAREFLRELLELWGHVVQTAEDGITGAELALRGGFDLALVDIGLPGMNGYEVARRVREAEAARGTGERLVLVALTGYGQPEDRRVALESGFDEHRVKPLDAEELRGLLRLPPSKSAFRHAV
ncbi:MAG: response regulator [Myxococcaceae bacterium]|nr:response regulator [Myxococcaceae bacterium]